MTGNLNMGNNCILNLESHNQPKSAVNKRYVEDNFAELVHTHTHN